MNIKIALLATAACLGAVACGPNETTVTERDVSARSQPDGIGVNDGLATPPTADANQPSPLGAPTTRAPGPTSTAQADNRGLGQTPAANAVQDAVAGPVGQVNAAIVGGDTEAYLRNAALGDMYEIQAGQLALSRSDSAAIHQIARAIVDDHRALSDAMKAASLDSDVTFVPPASLDERRQGLIDNLQAASAEDFDEVYLDQQEAAHEEALNLHESYRDRGDVEALRTVAIDAIPLIEGHLERIRAAQDSMSDGPAAAD